MATKTIKTQIGLRRDTEANYELVKDTFTPIKGEICLVETATGVRMKVGDGTTTYGGLSYLDTEVLNQILALDTNKQDKLTAGNNITIDDNGVISATGGGGTGGGTTAHVINEDTLVFKNNGVENLSLMIEKTCLADDFSDLSFTYNEFTFLLNNPQAYVVLHYNDGNDNVFSFALRQIKGVDVDQGVVAVPDMLNLYGGGKIGDNPLNLLVRIEYADDETLTTTVQQVDIYETGVNSDSTGATYTEGTGINIVDNTISIDETYVASKSYVADELAKVQTTITQGNGIKIENDVVSVDTTVIATQTYVNDQIAEQHQDLGSNLFTLTNSDQFNLVQQHSYQVGSLIFIHITFRPTKAPDATGMFTFGTLSKKPQHNHSCAIAAINESTGNTITEGATIKTDGTITVHLTKSTASSNYLFDICCCFCESN